MSRHELGRLRLIASAIEAEDYRVAEMHLWLLIETAAAEHAAEDRHNDWLELAEQSLQEAA